MLNDRFNDKPMALKTLAITHPQAKVDSPSRIFRRAARALIEHQGQVLLLYTDRYQDYSFAGGGLDEHEDLAQGLLRELAEETGAQDIQIGPEFLIVDELRPHTRPDAELMHMQSHYFFCQINPQLGQHRMEDYERQNGMRPVWVPLEQAIAHNLGQMAAQAKTMGLSLARETQVMELWAQHRQQSTAVDVRQGSCLLG